MSHSLVECEPCKEGNHTGCKNGIVTPDWKCMCELMSPSLALARLIDQFTTLSQELVSLRELYQQAVQERDEALVALRNCQESLLIGYESL